FGSEAHAYLPNGQVSPYVVFDLKQPIYGYQAYPSVGDDGTLYVRADGGVFAFAKSGATVWSYSVGGSNAGPAIGEDGTLYTTSVSSVMAIGSDGPVRWQYAAPNEGDYVYFVSIAADGSIYAGGDRFYVIASNGTLINAIDVGNGVTSAIA